MQHLITSQWYQCTASGTYLPVNSQFWTKTHTHIHIMDVIRKLSSFILSLNFNNSCMYVWNQCVLPQVGTCLWGLSDQMPTPVHFHARSSVYVWVCDGAHIKYLCYTQYFGAHAVLLQVILLDDGDLRTESALLLPHLLQALSRRRLSVARPPFLTITDARSATLIHVAQCELRPSP